MIRVHASHQSFCLTPGRTLRMPPPGRPLVWVPLLALVLAMAGCRPSEQSEARLTLEPCQLSSPNTSERQEAKCGRLQVAENPDAPEGRTLSLRVAVVKANGGNVQPDPLFLLAGGPGQGAVEAFLPVIPALARILKDRDLVLVDQRGTGDSHPLRCPEQYQDPGTVTLEQALSQSEECRRALEADLRFYHTALAMDDLEKVRDALGYKQINLYGGSYGTRAALVYLRRHPQWVRSVILDAVNTPTQPLGSTLARDARRSLDQLFLLCSKDPGCAAAFPKLHDDLERLLARVSAAPVKAHFRDPVTDEARTMTFSRRTLVETLFSMSYSPFSLALLPLMVHHSAESGDLGRLAAQAYIFGLSQDLATGMHLAVICSEDIPFVTDADIEAHRARGSLFEGSARLEEYRALCETWPRASLPPDAREPVESDVPVLLLSGFLDPVTPPERAEEAAKTLPRSKHLVLPQSGHAQIVTGCMPSILAEFLKEGSADSLDTRCLEQQRSLPFFTSFKGPQP